MILHAAALALSLAVQEPAPRGPADWKVEVVARYPDLKFPSVLCFAPDGRLFVGEDPMDMDGPVNKPIDRILCIHPDGRITVFAENLYAVFGLQYLDGKLYVHHTPRFSVFTDGGDVGKDRVDLIECTNPNPAPGFNDHIPSNCRLGMDSYLYVSVGDKGLYGAVGKDGRTGEIFGGGVFRIRPDGTGLEVYSTGTRNHLDVAVTDEDELFTYDNTDDGHGWWTRVTHMVDGGFYGYPWDYKPRRPHTLWMMGDFGGGSGCASIAYTADALPEKYRGNLFLSDWARKEVLRLEIVREGASWKIASTEKFLKSEGPQEFRPLGLAVSPDGMSLYVCDWNYGGWVAKGKQTGRLIKATYTGGASLAAPKPAWWAAAGTGKPFEASTADLVAALGHPSHEVRLVAQRRLADRKAGADLEGVLASGSVVAKRHAIWALDALGGSGAVVAALKDPDVSVRRQAARQLGTRAVRAAAGPLAAMLQDDDRSIRFQAATALGRIGRPESVPALQGLLEESDLFARYAAFTALNRIGRAAPEAWPAIVAGLDHSSARVREGSLFACRETYEAALAEALAAGPRTPAGRALALEALAGIHRKPAPWTGKWWGTQPVAQPRPAKVVDHAGTARALQALRAGLADADAGVRRAAAEGAAAARDTASAEALRGLAGKDADVEVRRAALRALGALKDAASAEVVAAAFQEAALVPDAVGAAEQIGGPALAGVLVKLAGSEAPAGTLAACAQALGRLKSGAEALGRLARHSDATVAVAALKSLAEIGGEAAAAALAPAIEDARTEVRKAALAAAGSTKSAALLPALLKASLDKAVRFEAIGALAQVPDLRALDAYLEGLGGKNATLRDACRKALSAVSAGALPLLEAKLDRQELSADVLSEIQRVYAVAVPVTRWRLLGSFAADSKPPFALDAVPPDEEHKDAQGKPVRWKPAKCGPDGRVNLRSQMTVPDDVVAWAVAELDSASDRDVELVGGSDDSIAIWLNGAKLHEDLRNQGYKADAYRARGRLKAGRNLLVVRCGNAGGGWEFSVSVPAAREGRLFQAVPKKLDPKAYAEFARKNAGDAARGRALYSDLKGVACIKCHKLEGQGGEVGPAMDGVGAKYGREHFIESILSPSAKILDGYKQTMVLTRSGDVKAGRFLGDAGDELVLMDAEGRKLQIRKSDIEQRREAELSLMPEGLNTGLSTQDFADLVAFLESLKK